MKAPGWGCAWMSGTPLPLIHFPLSTLGVTIAVLMLGHVLLGLQGLAFV